LLVFICDIDFLSFDIELINNNIIQFFYK
jgi:hypothetical protein